MIEKDFEVSILQNDDSFEEWDRFVENSPQGCIFCKSWWLRTVCNNNFSILILTKSGRIVAGMPLPVSHRFGLKYITMPLMTQTLGILFEPSTAEKYEHQISKIMGIMKVIIDNIPRFSYLSMNFQYNFTNWLPFYWAGYRQTTRYTYVINDLTDLNKIYDGIAHNTKNKIKKAKEYGLCISDDDVEAFLYLNRKTFARQNMELPYSTEFIKKINDECVLRKSGKIFVAQDTHNRIHAAVFVIYDPKSMFCLASGGDPQLRQSGAGALLRWHAIEFAQKVTRKFDFEGSMMRGVEPFSRSFGGIQMPYFNIYKDNRLLFVRMSDEFRSSLGRILLEFRTR